MMINYSSKDILYSAYANSKASSLRYSLLYRLLMRSFIICLYSGDVVSGLTAILLSSNQEHPDKSKSKIMSNIFIRSIIAVIGNFVNKNGNKTIQ